MSIRTQLDAFNARADQLAAQMRSCRNTDTTQIIAINHDRAVLNAEARAAGFVRLFDGRFRLSGKQMVQSETPQ